MYFQNLGCDLLEVPYNHVIVREQVQRIYVENQEDPMIEPQRHKAQQIRVHVLWDIF